MIVNGVNMLPGQAEYPKNQWYVIAWSHEVNSEKTIAREVCDEPVVLYRTEAGEVKALFNRCPHRGMPLHSDTGRIVNDTLMCGYHGIRFGADGRCVEIPSGGVIPNKLCVKSYPVVELSHWIWIWPGDPQSADTSLIPDHFELGLTDPSLFSEPGITLEVKANYLMPLENLVDATHITFLHHGLIDTGNVATHPYRLEVAGGRIATVREFTNEPLPPMLKASMGIKGERVDRKLTLTAYANHLAQISQEFIDVDDPEAAPGRLELVVALTPAGPKRTVQYALFATSFENKHPGRFDDLRRLLMEDVVVIEEIQILFDTLGAENAPEVSVKSDEANIRSRRFIADSVAAERSLIPSRSVEA
ncbi:aromatic ring-hydroxylating dioxygenase subunit alpha [Pseudomonas sp. PB101]|uniref:aromatic ring-hydroxylating dioxygenase subunit alpha n=1 Tax=Pseudomonas sp. PB101 TaxID=2495428 RepID=UPI0013661632|nr:aromatic ring-hydroxylating dioxygenase subunit alpha [Pseudomonas sp. PB101]